MWWRGLCESQTGSGRRLAISLVRRRRRPRRFALYLVKVERARLASLAIKADNSLQYPALGLVFFHAQSRLVEGHSDSDFLAKVCI